LCKLFLSWLGPALVEREEPLAIVLGKLLKSVISQAYFDFLPTICLFWRCEERLIDLFEQQGVPRGTPQTVLNFGGVGVADEYMGKGIAAELSRITLKNAQKRGFRHVQVWCTNTTSCHVFRDKLGFQVEEMIKYSDFSTEKGQKKPFLDIVDFRGASQPHHFLLTRKL
jgi:GNAT superfamily N-acetyltransferase